MQHFRRNPDSGVTSPSQVAIVGDRLLTDVMMANMMGSYGVWIRDGVKERRQDLTLVRPQPLHIVISNPSRLRNSRLVLLDFYSVEDMLPLTQPARLNQAE